jgi:hypothetical protein
MIRHLCGETEGNLDNNLTVLTFSGPIFEPGTPDCEGGVRLTHCELQYKEEEKRRLRRSRRRINMYEKKKKQKTTNSLFSYLPYIFVTWRNIP